MHKSPRSCFTSPSIINIVSGQIADEAVTVHDDVNLGKKKMSEYESGWPTGFYNTISKGVKTIADRKKHIKIGSKKLYDTTIIYSRVIGIQASSRNIDVQDVMSHELSPVPTSMFQDSGKMRLCKTKADLKNRLARLESSRVAAATTHGATILDGSAVLWVVHWPVKGVVSDFVNSFKSKDSCVLVMCTWFLTDTESTVLNLQQEMNENVKQVESISSQKNCLCHHKRPSLPLHQTRNS